MDKVQAIALYRRGLRPTVAKLCRVAAASQLGPSALTLAAKLNKGLGLSWGKVQDLFAHSFQLYAQEVLTRTSSLAQSLRCGSSGFTR